MVRKDYYVEQPDAIRFYITKHSNSDFSLGGGKGYGGIITNLTVARSRHSFLVSWLLTELAGLYEKNRQFSVTKILYGLHRT